MYRIAICEDEPSMARGNEAMIFHILESCHFRRDIDFSVASFSAPEPLLAVLRKQPSAFHLLLLDSGFQTTRLYYEHYRLERIDTLDCGQKILLLLPPGM